MKTYRWIKHVDHDDWLIRIEDGKTLVKLTSTDERPWNEACTMDGILEKIRKNHWCEIEQWQAQEILAKWDKAATPPAGASDVPETTYGDAW